ncbi:ribonuclease H-like domain-containing protein, partial [Tanacetum coccineum]
MSQPANDDYSQHLSDDEASYHEDASDNGTATNKPKQQQQQLTPTTTTISNIKLPILKKEEYDIWAMEMEHYLEYIDNDVWKVIQNGNSKKRISTGKDGVVRILPPVSAAEIHAVEKERKARTILLMAIPKEHLRRFHGMDDAKEIWEAIRTRFGGNANSKKMQKAVLKQQFEAFTISSSEGKSITNKVKSCHAGAYSTCTPSTSSNNILEREVPAGFPDEVIYSLFAKQSEDLDLLHEDLEQIDDMDIEEMDINWQIAMIDIRMKKFYKKTGRRVRIDGNKHVGFDKKKIECFKCHNTGHFARECPSNRTNDGKNRDSFYQDQGARKKEQNQNCLLTMDDGVVNWGEHTVEEEETNHAPMAIGSNNEWTSKAELVDLDDNYIEHSTCQSNDSEGSFGNPSKHSSESESESISVPNKMSTSKSVTTNEKVVSESKEVEPSCATHVKTPRQQMKNQGTPEVKGKNWNKIMERELGEDVIWVIFLATKDETSGILQNFIRQLNQDNYSVKIIRIRDKGTNLRKWIRHSFRGNKGIKQEYSNARTPQQNGVAKRMNRTLIEATFTNYFLGRSSTSKVTNSAGTLQTPTENASEEEDEDEELIVVPIAVKHTAAKVRPRKSSTNSKAEEFLIELQNLKTQEKEAYSTGISVDTPEILAFRRELDELAQKHLREVPKNKATSTNSVNSGSGPANTQPADQDDSDMPELTIFNTYQKGIFDEASYDDEGMVHDFNNLPIEVAVSPIPTLRIHNIHP